MERPFIDANGTLYIPIDLIQDRHELGLKISDVMFYCLSLLYPDDQEAVLRAEKKYFPSRSTRWRKKKKLKEKGLL